MDSLFIRIVRKWIPLAVATSAIFLTIYFVVQQDIRMDANDPQIQMAQDTAAALSSTHSGLTSESIDVSQSLAPFTIIYDAHGTIVASDAVLNGKTPEIPQGVLQAAKAKGENRITWQPQPGVRLATVVVPYKNGYVLAGRNMREIEFREAQQFNNLLLLWIITLMATLFTVIVLHILFKKKTVLKFKPMS